MNQDARRYERGVALAGWLLLCLRRGKTTFRRSELAEVDSLASMAGSAGAKRFSNALSDLGGFGVEVTYVSAVADGAPGNEEGAYRIRRSDLSPAEQRALISLSFAIAYEDWDATQHDMIPGAFTNGGGETVLLRSEPLLDEVAEVIHRRQPIEMVYKEVGRKIQPLHIAHRRGAWYLIGADLGDRAVKNYRIDKIERISWMDGHVWDPAWDDFDLEAQVLQLASPFFYGSSEDPLHTIRMAIEPGAQAWRYVPDAIEVDALDDGRVVLEFRARNVEHVIDRVVNLHARAEILEPPSVRESFVAHLQGMIR